MPNDGPTPGMRANALFDLRTADDDPRSLLDRAISGALRELSIDPSDPRTFRGAMHCSPALTGPPGRVHGGIHPILRTVPILERLSGRGPGLRRLRVEAGLQKPLPIGETAEFEGTYEADANGFVLTTRFLDSDRLLARATLPPAGPLLDAAALARWRALFETAQSEPRSVTRIVGIEYPNTPSLVWLELRTPDAIRQVAHVRGSFSDAQGFGLGAFSTQLDSVGVLARAEGLLHPHFTKHIEVSLDLDHVGPDTSVLILSDRTSIEPVPGSPTVEIRGEHHGTVRTRAVAVDAAFTRCFAAATITMHPIDPARFAGFDAMVKVGDRG